MQKHGPQLDGMVQLAVPLDEWCAFCSNKLATMHTADGVAACHACADEFLKSMAAYEDDAAFAVQPKVGPGYGGPNRAMRRAVQRRAKASRKRNRKR